MTTPRAETVGEMVARRPAAARVFERFGIDYCCGGKRTLEDAARRAGTDYRAVLAALAHLAFNLDGNGPLIGASGAVAGVMGAYILLFPHARVFVLARIVIPIPLPVPAFWMLGFWVATQLFYVLIGSTEPVAWWAHIGGFLAGIALAPLMRRKGVPLLGGR